MAWLPGASGGRSFNGYRVHMKVNKKILGIDSGDEDAAI